MKDSLGKLIPRGQEEWELHKKKESIFADYLGIGKLSLNNQSNLSSVFRNILLLAAATLIVLNFVPVFGISINLTLLVGAIVAAALLTAATTLNYMDRRSECEKELRANAQDKKSLSPRPLGRENGFYGALPSNSKAPQGAAAAAGRPVKNAGHQAPPAASSSSSNGKESRRRNSM